MKTVKTPDDVPSGEHYTIIRFKYVTRNYPSQGHGYPAYSETVTEHEYTVTTSKDEWLKEIQAMELVKSKFRSYNEKYVALHVQGKAKINVKIEID